jgi:amino acid transporter
MATFDILKKLIPETLRTTLFLAGITVGAFILSIVLYAAEPSDWIIKIMAFVAFGIYSALLQWLLKTNGTDNNRPIGPDRGTDDTDPDGVLAKLPTGPRRPLIAQAAKVIRRPPIKTA